MTETSQSKCGCKNGNTAEKQDNLTKMVIGGATYIVSAHFKENGSLNVVDKVARLIDKEAETA